MGIYGMVAACSLQHMKGRETLEVTPRLLQRPDPDMALPTWIQVHVEDWFLHGNACHLITAYGADSYPAAMRWFPAHQWGIQDRNGQPVYLLNGREVPREQVVHVKRGVDPGFMHRGIGVVEQYLGTLNRAGLEAAAETANLSTRGMPSVAVIQPDGSTFDQTNADKVAEKWEERFAGQSRRPGVFPAGTQVMPLSWNPVDQQLVQARGMTIKDIANAANLDGYWLGAEGSSHTYRSPQPMFLTLLRTSLNPMLRTFEDEWSTAWLPYGRTVAFDRLELLRDDLQTMVATFAQGITAGLFPDLNEPRQYMGFPALPDVEEPATPEFQSVGLPALITAGVITREDARKLMGLSGPPPDEPDVPEEEPTDEPAEEDEPA
jgi:HK97 family phage portal protein